MLQKIFAMLALMLLTACAPAQQPVQNVSQPIPQPVQPSDVDKVITVEEGVLAALEVSAFDPDGDPLTLMYSAPFDAGGQWQTEVGDAGTYLVIVTASDGVLTTEKKIRVIVTPKNKAPRISQIPDVKLHVGDTVRFEPVVMDPDGDAVTLRYEGWMTANEKTATQADIGQQVVTIIASDGELEDRKVVPITIRPPNNPPMLSPLAGITVSEGDLITLNPGVSDPDGDNLTITYSGWMTDRTKVASYEDAGTHEVIVTASDGELTAVQSVTITVKDRPRAPEIVLG